MKNHKYNSGIIGNGSYIAHINTKAEIVWLCWPNFDSSPIFGSLLDKNCGHFSILPDSNIISTSQVYLENTNILRTEIVIETGSFAVLDFAPRYYQNGILHSKRNLYRKIIPITGDVKVKFQLNLTYSYGKEYLKPRVNSEGILYQTNDFQLHLTSNVSLNQILKENYFLLNQNIYLALFESIPTDILLGEYIESEFKKTKHYWQNWVKHCSIPIFAQKQQIRSALCLKLHQFQETGAIIASSTTSLPEAPLAGRNWDYRFCWLRDGFYTLLALTNLGQFEELEMYSQYISNLTPTAEGRYQPLYSIFGENFLEEKILELEGYLSNKPVRIGNSAYTHKQNDAYGQILLSLLPLYLDERIPEKNRFHNLGLVKNILEQIELTMEEPDAGLWEFRNFSQKHCYTYLFHWIGAKAAKEIALKLGRPDLIEKSEILMEQAATNIEKCYDDKLGCYTQAQGKKDLDASLLQLITLGYLDPKSEKAKSHIAAIEKTLKTENGFMYRYLHQDDFGKPETTFLVCTFWYIEALACMSRLEEAMKLFDFVCEHANHLGLFSEDIESKSGNQWGNFPQTYSHVGLVNAARKISQKKSDSLFW
ncbi:glycoside hydrolase family 15 protein [Leptospira bandrabouensis]|uniref:Glycoside hydrolase family 15 protein n=1 Tax=Leptospira bandrabouensis TaxID=2484903 RepID=A0A6H3NY70_9LEPT|nr:glycoside hydrolase family 15 protein [Leptospira bandrabouensis]MCG6153510.1 glycoside hydrolase family 15 protein [Leptospira bandrabouensis]TGN05923.1 glycoside hydrolase family 15 protein [Leptospira bandrabouensis]TGN16256.1 glycoside hydrolase family 15 protein [Leptospira bandrabouensis]